MSGLVWDVVEIEYKQGLLEVGLLEVEFVDGHIFVYFLHTTKPTTT